MPPYPLLQSFFHDVDEYIKYQQGSGEWTKANHDGTCFAQLTRQKDRYIYMLSWEKANKSIGDYVKLFDATPENIARFNEGCRILAERLTIYIDTNDAAAVPSEPPAFGELTFVEEQPAYGGIIRELLIRDFNLELPISGGTGDSKDTAIIIHRAACQDYVKMEYQILYCICKNRGMAFEKIGQELHKHHDRYLDKINIETTRQTETQTITQVENYYFDVTECFGNA